VRSSKSLPLCWRKRCGCSADVPVGCYLSGGLDSCSVLGFAARLSSSRIQAFTLTFEQGEYEEGDIAREKAARVGASFHPIPYQAV